MKLEDLKNVFFDINLTDVCLSSIESNAILHTILRRQQKLYAILTNEDLRKVIQEDVEELKQSTLDQVEAIQQRKQKS